jgi:mannosyl-3-phosphoglycerate phosphatase
VTARDRNLRLLVFTDLDGTLLDSHTYSYEAALPALRALKQRHIPLVIVSSKTRAELEPIRNQLENEDPFVTENGGAVFVPMGTFKFPLNRATSHGPYQVIEFGTPYAKLRAALTEIARAAGCALKGFGDMSVDEIVLRTGLSQAEAALAKQREYDEPFVIIGAQESPPSSSRAPNETLRRVHREAEARGLRCTSGGRFHHLLGSHDKGQACRVLIECYRRQLGEDCRLLTIALGDSQNDRAMFAETDQAVLVQKPDGSFDPGAGISKLIRVDGIGPIGWNRAILELLGAARDPCN